MSSREQRTTGRGVCVSAFCWALLTVVNLRLEAVLTVPRNTVNGNSSKGNILDFARQDSLLRHERLHDRDPERQSHHSPVGLPLTPASQSSSHDDRGLDETPTTDLLVPSETADPSASILNDQRFLPLADLDGFDLIWPDAEDLFQSITSLEPSSQWPLPLGVDSFSEDSHQESHSSFRSQPPSITNIPLGANHQAVNDVSSMISGLVGSPIARAVFLDECLHMFFIKFSPTLPVLHRPTFVFRDSLQSLLLNAIAIGSLYLGPKDSIGKGEVLWHLAHTAMATSWQSLITHRGPYDDCAGIQLVIAALLGQLYGTLSKNRSIRTTSQAFHSLSFFWARHCGMFESQPFSNEDLPAMNAPLAEKEHKWKVWGAKEVQRRAILSLYLLDGLVAQMTAKPTAERHTANPLVVLACEGPFMAETADEWYHEILSTPMAQSTFRETFRRLFSSDHMFASLNDTCSSFSIRVLLEGIQSIVMDTNDSGVAIGVPDMKDIRLALRNIYESIIANGGMSSEERSEALLRWHSVCLEAITKTSALCKALCSCYGIEQHVWPSSKVNEELDATHLAHWTSTGDGRRALLHAVAIQDIIEQLPRGRAHAIHMPVSLFAAATVYSVFTLAGLMTTKLPSQVDWRQGLEAWTQGSVDPLQETTRFIRGEVLPSPMRTSRNLLYELNSMQKLFGCLATQWGVSADMEKVVSQCISLCHR
ncbi:hypothetical protein FH972_021280 [Carpinus fangiana]|uniref:Xylanolytic transcriptional activator regulatory domain-containing protein n=1 Tax=Carpinus fangiana TaxID=176857 RepID=A0A5N6KPA2_9ROSI|nr:hypothetical protein FH972_021280 [Carpinus fangiana]